MVSLLNLKIVIVIYLVSWLQKDVSKAKSREVVEFFESGFGIHNAGMIRSDRSLMERLFADGLLKVSLLSFSVDLQSLRFAIMM